MAKLEPVSERLLKLSKTFFNKIHNPEDRLHDILPTPRENPHTLRNRRKLPIPSLRTSRCQKSLIPYASKNFQYRNNLINVTCDFRFIILYLNFIFIHTHFYRVYTFFFILYNYTCYFILLFVLYFTTLHIIFRLYLIFIYTYLSCFVFLFFLSLFYNFTLYFRVYYYYSICIPY